MPDNLDANFIAKVRNELKTKVLERLDKIAIQAHNRLTTQTPVDFGQARAGWNYALNIPDTTIPEVKDKKRDSDGNALVVIQPEVHPTALSRELGDSYYLTNGVKHVKYLNEGTSAQAPSNFIEVEVAAAVHDVESEA